MRNYFERLEETTREVVRKGLIEWFLVGDILVVLLSIGVTTVASAIIGFFIGTPYWPELLLGFVVVYLTNFSCYMRTVRAALILMDEVDLDEYEKRLIEDDIIF